MVFSRGYHSELNEETMEPQERNASNNIENHNEQNQLVENLEDDEEIIQVLPLSPSKCSILKRFNDDLPNNDNHRDQPVSILKCKNLDNGAHKESSSSSLHITLPVTFSPSVIEHAHKRHGILKKRSSLDESEILYRRCRSPDVTFTENNYPEFRPILKNQRRFIHNFSNFLCTDKEEWILNGFILIKFFYFSGHH